MRRLAVEFSIVAPLSRWIGIAGFAAASMLAGGCASQSYMGISLVPGRAPTEVQDLARRAKTGDKQAQLELGIGYEEGVGLPKNIARAVKLYRSAATVTSTVWLWSPSVGNQGGRIMQVSRASENLGLVEARVRLKKLEHANAN